MLMPDIENRVVRWLAFGLGRRKLPNIAEDGRMQSKAEPSANQGTTVVVVEIHASLSVSGS